MIRELTPCLTKLEVALLVLSHQSRKGIFSRLWGQGLETNLPQQNKPKLPSEDTFNQKMVDCFLLLIT
jgi:hypothetical protein